MIDDEARDLDSYSRAYAASEFEVVQARYRKRVIIAALTKYQPHTILEVGCGHESIAQSWGVADQITIVEPSAVFRDRVMSKLDQRRDVVMFPGSLEEASITLKSKYDLIILSSLLHEVSNPEHLLKCAIDFSHKDTVFHINVPNANSFHRLLAVKMGLIDSTFEQSQLQRTLQQRTVFDLRSISTLVHGAGLECLERGTYFVKPFTHCQMTSMLKQGIIDDAVLDGLFKMTELIPDMGSELYINAVKRRP